MREVREKTPREDGLLRRICLSSEVCSRYCCQGSSQETQEVPDKETEDQEMSLNSLFFRLFLEILRFFLENFFGASVAGGGGRACCRYLSLIDFSNYFEAKSGETG